MIRSDTIIVSADAVDELKTYVRVEVEDEDALLASLIASALAHGESFTGLSFLQRPHVDILPVSSAWQRVAATPVQSVSNVNTLPAEGPSVPLAIAAYAIDIDNSGDGWVRVIESGAAKRVSVSFIAGVAPDWASLPQTIRHAVIRLAAHLHAIRDAVDDPGPPAIVAALWRPWRRMRLT